MSETDVLEKSQEDQNIKAKVVSDLIEKKIKDFRDNFQCHRCGKCCQEGVGVALWPHEFKRLKKYIHGAVYKHIIMIGNWHALKMPCVFYQPPKRFIPGSKGHCKIYEHRPIACRMYPLGIRPDASTVISQNCSALKPKE